MHRLAVLLLPVAAWIGHAELASAETVDPDAYCGDDSYYWVTEPAGWEEIPDDGVSVDIASGFSFGFRPPATREGEEVSLMMRVKGSVYEGPDADPRDVLSSAVGLLVTLGSEVEELRELQVAHRALPSAGVQVIGEKGRAYVVAVGIPDGGGSHAVLALTVSGRAASAAELDALKAMLDSFRYDADHHCHPSGDGLEKRKIRRRPAPTRGSDDTEVRRAERARDAAAGFSLRRASLGCALNAQLFVPVACGMTEVQGERVFLVEYYGDKKSYGGTPLEQFLKAHTRRIALPWCFETRTAVEPPTLVFRGSESGALHSFDCRAMRLSGPIPESEPNSRPAERDPAAASDRPHR